MLKISVVIPLYNKEKHIKRAIDSVFAQTVQDFEIIVVDDGSTDKSAEVVKEIKDTRVNLIQQANQGECAARNRGIEAIKIKPIDTSKIDDSEFNQMRIIYRNKPGPGGHAARNEGINEARSKLIAFLDADDAWKPYFLETILRLKLKFPRAGVYATAYEIKEPNGKIVKPEFKAIPQSPWEGIIPNYFKSCLGEPPVWSSAIAVSKKVFDTVGKFPEGEKMGGDLDTWLRIALNYPIAYSNTIGATYYRDSSNRVCLTEYSISDYRLVSTAREAILNNKISNENKLYLAEYVCMKEIERAGRCIIRGEKKKARQILKESHTRYFKRKKIFFFMLTFFPTNIVRFFRSLKKKILS